MKLSSSYYLDPEVASLPDADAEVGFVRSLAFAGAKETGGFIRIGVAPSLFRRRRYQASVDALVAASLWLPVTGATGQLEGWQIVRWQEWQEELEALARRRAADRDRKRRKRAEEKPSQEGVRGHVRGQSADSPNLPPDPPLEKEREKGSPTGNPPRAQAREAPPWSAADEALIERMLSAWWDRYGSRTAQRRRTVLDAITDALRNGLDPDELWSALLRLGDTNKPVTGNTLTFALADVRRPPGGPPAATGQRPSTTDERVAQGQALAAKFRALEQEGPKP